ncbi:hypothetical protein, partial [Enterobacter cloacae complex sp. IR5422]|uniref:hypothetical protein n=1 Tax=Enterobacter cloacae complex sp. IR5422 TaxID=3412363 RepID=UPI003BA08876
MRHVMYLIAWRLSSIDFVVHTRQLNNPYCDIAHAKMDIKRFIFIREVAIKWSAAPDMTPQTVLYRRPVAQFSNFQPKIVSSWLILAL